MLGNLVAQRRREVEVGRLAARLTPGPNEDPRNPASVPILINF